MSEKKETKRERFVRVAQKRTQTILDTIRLLGNCSTKNNYDYTQEDVQKIFAAIDKELKIAKQRFLYEDTSDEKFTL